MKGGRKREGERKGDSEAGRKDRIYQDWKPRILKKMGIEGGGALAVGMEAFKTRRPMPCSRQKDTTRATFAGRNPRATGVRLLLTHVTATFALSVGLSVRCRSHSHFCYPHIFNKDWIQSPSISSHDFSQRVDHRIKIVKRQRCSSILLSTCYSDVTFFLVSSLIQKKNPHRRFSLDVVGFCYLNLLTT